jgi:cytochrome c-type biogenesis protein CcmF
MEGIQYIGENLVPGQIGHLAIVLAFVSSLLGTVAYFFATHRQEQPEYQQWRSIGRSAFLMHGLSIFTVIGVIFYVMVNQFYEYQYVWAHVSEDLPFKYIFSAFWEGQEGSFLLWMFWHVVLGVVLMITAKDWEAPVMSVISLIQVFIVSMILGLYIGLGEEAVKIGSNPLLLLRETMDAPIFNQADYLELIKGNGLNPLLQNYWMTIHPPTLFLGFASTAVPFAFAIAGLWKRRHREWLKPALPWALFSGAILGTGILMGGAWAYEALSFGGYWAWDPVENMSLVPWLTLIAGIHTNLIARKTKYSIRSAYVFYLLTFVLIVYSTFLTRSGVLGETSVHAFTEMGLEWQLVAFMAAFLGLSAVLMATRYKGIPTPEREESVASKEFWMFIGALVLLFSALIITASTSLPVFNKVVQYFDPTFEGRVITDPESHYNKYHLWIGIFIGLLSGAAQYLRFRERNWRKFVRRFGVHLGAAIVITALLSFLTSQWIDIYSWQYWLLLFAGLFTVVANLDYLITFIQGNLKLAGSAFSHIGFGVMIVGILASGLNKRYISSNPFVMDGLIQGASEQSQRNNILLFKGEPMAMGEYEVTYVKDTLDGYTRTYTVNYKRRNAAGEIVEEFNLHPNVLYEKTFTKIAASNPSTKRYLHKDIFTHIASLPEVEMNFEFRNQREDSLNYRTLAMGLGEEVLLKDTVPIRNRDTFMVKDYRVSLESIDRAPVHPDYKAEPNDLAVGARIGIHSPEEDKTYYVEPVIVLRGQFLYQYPVQINDLSTKVRLNEGIFEQLFVPEEELDYQEFTLKQGEEAAFNGLRLRFLNFKRDPEHPNYQPAEGDIAVSALIEVQNPVTGDTYLAEPVFLIRGNRPYNIKDQIDSEGLHLRFTELNPKTESITLMVAQAKRGSFKVPVDIATDSLRSDYIVLEAILFPGINLFWLGSVLMMIGLGISMWWRIWRP